MKKVLFFFVVSAFCINIDAQVRSDAEVIMSIFKIEKKAMVMDYLQISEKADEKFWNLYADYEEKREKLAARRIEMLGKYTSNHNKSNDAAAKSVSKEFFAIRKGYLKLQKKYNRKMAKVIGASKANDFIHLEEYIEMNIRTELLDVVPFVGED
jgi:SLT domain-containing protein